MGSTQGPDWLEFGDTHCFLSCMCPKRPLQMFGELCLCAFSHRWCSGLCITQCSFCTLVFALWNPGEFVPLTKLLLSFHSLPVQAPQQLIILIRVDYCLCPLSPYLSAAAWICLQCSFQKIQTQDQSKLTHRSVMVQDPTKMELEELQTLWMLTEQ